MSISGFRPDALALFGKTRQTISVNLPLCKLCSVIVTNKKNITSILVFILALEFKYSKWQGFDNPNPQYRARK